MSFVNPKTCKFFNNDGKCIKESGCKFLHIVATKASRQKGYQLVRRAANVDTKTQYNIGCKGPSLEIIQCNGCFGLGYKVDNNLNVVTQLLSNDKVVCNKC